jgi:ABC-type nitrate/sulfonate/bicarbonate transport system substrate-binding protein
MRASGSASSSIDRLRQASPSRRQLLAGASTAALAAIAGCSGSPAQQAASTATRASAKSSASGAAATTVNVGIDIPFHPIWDYVKANSATYFAKSGYSVNFRVLDATTQVPAFGAGQLDVVTTVPSFMPIIKQQYKIDTTYIFPLARWTIGPQILVPKGSPFKTLESLKGKKVAIPPLKERFGAEQAAVYVATGEKIQDYFNLQQTDAAPQQLSLGRVDAAFLEAPTTYPLLTGGKFVAIYSVHDAFLKAFGDPAVLNGGYIGKTSFVQQNPGFVKSLAQATRDAWNLYNSDPTHVNTVASRVSGVPVAQLQTVAQVLDLTMSTDLRQVLPRDVTTWEKLFPVLQKAGFIQQAPAGVPGMFVVTSNIKLQRWSEGVL